MPINYDYTSRSRRICSSCAYKSRTFLPMQKIEDHFFFNKIYCKICSSWFYLFLNRLFKNVIIDVIALGYRNGIRVSSYSEIMKKKSKRKLFNFRSIPQKIYNCFNFFFEFQLCTLGPIGFLKNIEAAARSKPSKKILMVSESVHHFCNNVISDNIYSHVILSNKWYFKTQIYEK